MNPELHHRWNSEQALQRELGKPADKNPNDEVPQNKLLLKQNKPK